MKRLTALRIGVQTAVLSRLREYVKIFSTHSAIYDITSNKAHRILIMEAIRKYWILFSEQCERIFQKIYLFIIVHIRYLLPLILIFAGIVYFLTKPPSILWIDSGTMIAASKSLGIPNPPGFPLYMLISHFFAILPFASVLTRLELFTIVWSLILLFFLYNIILLLIDTQFLTSTGDTETQSVATSHPYLSHLAAFFATMSLAFSYEYWSQSENTEAFIFTYALLTIFVYICLRLLQKYVAFKMQKNPDKTFDAIIFRWIILIAVAFGIGTGANPTIAVFLPIYLYLLFIFRDSLTQRKLLIVGVSFFLAVLVIYSYLPVRARSYPFVNWGNPQTLPLFIGQLQGKGLNIYEPQTNTINGFTGSPLVFIQSVFYFLYLFFIQFTPFVILLAPLGMYVLWKKNKTILILLLLAPLTDVTYAGLYFSGNQESWFIPVWIFMAIFIGIGFYFSFQYITKTPVQKILLTCLCILPLLVWIGALNRSHHYYSKDYGYNLYFPLEKNAIILGSGDFFNSLTYYLHEADIYRRDITPITVNTFYVNKWYRDDIRHATPVYVSSKIENIIQYKHFDEYNRAMNTLIADNIAKHPIYITPLALRASALAGTTSGELQLDNRFKLIPNGLTLRVVYASSTEQPNFNAFQFQIHSAMQTSPFYIERNYIGAFQNIQDDYIYAYQTLADWYIDHGNSPQAIASFKKGLAISQYEPNLLGDIGNYMFKQNQYSSAISFYQNTLLHTSQTPEIHYNLGLSYEKSGAIQNAVNEFKAVLQLTDSSQEIYQNARNELAHLTNQPISQTGNGPTQNGWTSITDKQNVLSFQVPPGFSYANGDISTVTNPQLSIAIHGHQLTSQETVDSYLATSSLQPPTGVLLATKPYTIPGFQTTVKIYGLPTGKALLFFVLQKDTVIYEITASPADSPQMASFYQLLNTIQPIQ